MLMEITETPLLPVGQYPATVKSIELDKGDYGEQLKWTFTVLAPAKFAGALLSAWSSTSTSNKGKTCRWAAACTGSPVVVGDQLDTADLIGQRVDLIVIEKPGKDGVFNKVEDLKIHVKKVRPAAPAVEEVSDAVEAFLSE